MTLRHPYSVVTIFFVIKTTVLPFFSFSSYESEYRYSLHSQLQTSILHTIPELFHYKTLDMENIR